MSKKFTDINELLDWLEVRTKEEYETYLYRPQIILLLDYIKKLRQENQQLKDDYSKLLETSKAYKKLLKTTMQKEHQVTHLLDEIREYINIENYKDENICVVDGIGILQILDKVKE